MEEIHDPLQALIYKLWKNKKGIITNNTDLLDRYSQSISRTQD